MTNSFPALVPGASLGPANNAARPADPARTVAQHWVKPLLGQVTALDYAADVLAGAGGEVCCVWSTKTHALILRIVTAQPITALGLSKDGQWLALAAGNRVQVFRVGTGKLAFDYEHASTVASIHIAARAALLASVDTSGEVQLRHLVDGSEAWRIQHRPGRSVVFLEHNGKAMLVETDADTTIFDLQTREPIQTFLKRSRETPPPPGAHMENMLLSYTGSTLWLFDAADDELACFRKIDLDAPITSIDIAEPGSLFLATTPFETIHFFNRYTGERVGTQQSFTGPLLGAKFGGGRTIYAAGGEGLILQLDGGRHVRSYFDDSPPIVAGCWASPRALLLTDRDGGVSRYSLDNGRRTDFVGHADSVSVVVSDGEHVATGAYDGTARLWRPDGRQLAVFSPDDGPVQSLALDRVRHALWVGTWGGKVHAYDLSTRTGKLMGGLTAPVRTLCLDAQSHRLLAGDNDGDFVVVDLESSVWPMFTASVRGAAYRGLFDADGSVLITAGDGLRRYRFEQGGEPELYPCEEARWFEFLPDGNLCVLGLHGHLKVFEPTTQRCINEIHLDDPRPHRVVLAMGDRIFTGSGDGRMRVFDSKLNQVAELQHLRSGVLWTTTSAGAHPGWFFTDRAELVAIGSLQDGVAAAWPEGDSRKRLHQATFNSAAHTMEVLAGSLNADPTRGLAHGGPTRISASGLQLTFQHSVRLGGAA